MKTPTTSGPGIVISLLRIRELCLKIYETIYNELKEEVSTTPK